MSDNIIPEDFFGKPPYEAFLEHAAKIPHYPDSGEVLKAHVAEQKATVKRNRETERALRKARLKMIPKHVRDWYWSLYHKGFFGIWTGVILWCIIAIVVLVAFFTGIAICAQIFGWVNTWMPWWGWVILVFGGMTGTFAAILNSEGR